MAGQLDDNPGTLLTMAVEMLAAAIQNAGFPDGREFCLIQYEPTDTLGNSRFVQVEFAHRHESENPRDLTPYTSQTIIITPDGETTTVPRAQAKKGTTATRPGGQSKTSPAS